MKDLSASIVVYENAVEILERTIQSFLRNTLDSCNVKNVIRSLPNGYGLTISWCFMFLRTEALKKVGLFDSEHEFFNKRTIQQLAE